MRKRLLAIAAALLCALTFATGSSAAELAIGAASADITPDQPVALDGQMGLRVAKSAETPITANVIALESREGGRSLDAAVMVSCDMVQVSDTMAEKIHESLRKRLPDFDLKKLILSATHTHTAPVAREGIYDIPEGVMTPTAFCVFAGERIAEAIEKAWNSRKPGSVTWGLGHAAIAENRRATYADGHAVMYGATNTPDFRGLEGYVDHDVNALFFWNSEGKLLAIAVDVPCPSQEVEGLSVLNADYWHPTRELLRKRFGQDVCILGLAGAAGDQSPHLMYRKAAEERMLALRKLSRPQELGRRVAAAVEEIYETVKDDRHDGLPLIHKTETLQLPMRLVTDAEYKEVKEVLEKKNPAQMEKRWHEKIVRRYELQKTNPHPTHETTIHVLRIGDVAIATNSFELFGDFGIQMQARSPALQTFVVELAGNPNSYLPNQRAAAGGGYSAIVQSNEVGPEGGQVLVERTVELLNSFWANAGK